MNPFKHKQLEEFTIADCELYISRYPYGEHVFVVKRLLRELKKKMAEQPSVTNGEGNLQTEKQKETKSKTIKLSNNSPKQTNEKSSSKDVVKTIFAWIGIIVVVLVVGTIIITILNEILPYNWWNKYRYIIYPAGLALGRWLQKEFNWE
ncbi:unknown [Eggerthella sp. CAG:1427]|nr:unknown [Eggerthella sp. CAG:1427]